MKLPLLQDLTHRDHEATERMDDPACDVDALHRTYAQFEIVNRLVAGWQQAYRSHVRPVLRADRTNTLLDMGAGGADVTRAIARWAHRDGFILNITAADPDERAYAWAMRHHTAADLEFCQALSSELVSQGRRFDVVISNHLVHHLSGTEFRGLLRDCEHLATSRVIHNDIQRSRLAYALFSVGTRPFFRKSFIREDGLTSIRRSYTAAELRTTAPAGQSLMSLPHTCQVLIVGGGPVGLVMAGLLAQHGIDVVVLERRKRPRQYSRAIGLHPPALAVLNALRLEDSAVAQGRRVHAGSAYSHGPRLGGLRFERAWPDRPFVLMLPQNRTEALLSQRLTDLAPGALQPGWEALEVQDPTRPARPGAQVQVRARHTPAHGRPVERTWSADLLIGADGPRSLVRRTARIGLHAQPLPDTYLMGDFAQHHSWVVSCHDDAAAIFLPPNGVVESFPLPGAMRRWVAHTGTTLVPETPETLTRLIAERTGEQVDPDTSTMMSAFRVRRRLAQQMAIGRCVIIGDAAHEVSPIGGQGMTLGWLDAWHLAPLIAQVLTERRPAPLQHMPAIQRFEYQRLSAARAVARQAELNMALGRPMRPSTVTIRDGVLRAGLATGLRHRLAKAFSMRQPLGGLETQIPR